MRISRILVFTNVLLIISSFSSKAQDTELKPLDDVLIFLENKFDVAFTFADKNIAGIHVTLPKKDSSLDEWLVELHRQTSLEFVRLDSRYIAIRFKNRMDIVSGTVIDKTTKKHISGAVVYSGESYVVSDESGFFSLKTDPEKDSIVIIRHIGYKSLQLPLSSINTSVFELVPDIRFLEEVMVNYIAKGLYKLNDGAVQMNVENFEVLPGLTEPDILHAIQVLPGIQSANETVSEINTRGGTNDQNLVLWDGVKMYQTGHFFGLISAFNSHLIHKTKIVKNGTSASFGEGISGVIDMSQQDFLVKDFEASAGINMIGADVILKIPVNQKLSFIFGGRHSINNLIETPTYKRYYERAFEHTEVFRHQYGNDTTIEDTQNFSFYDLSGKLLYDISDKDKIRLSFLNIDNTIEYDEIAFIVDTLYRRESHLKQSSLLSNLQYARIWNEKHSTHLSAFLSNYQLDGRNADFNDGQNHLQENEVIDWGLKLDSENKISDATGVTSGYHFNEIGIRNLDNIQRPDYTRNVKDVLRIHSLYTEAKLQNLFDRIYLRLGLRANYFPKFREILLEPRAVLNFKFNQYLSFEILSEKKSQHTVQLIDYQTDFLGVEKRRWVLSNNQSVPLIKSQQFSLGVQYNRNNFLITLEGYKKHVSGIITPSQGFQNQYQFVYSTGNYSAKGIEFLAAKHFKKSNFWLTYTLAQNDYFFEDFTPSVFPNNLDVRHALSSGGNYSFKDIDLSAGLNYRTGSPYTKPARDELSAIDEIIYEEPNSSRMEDYLRLDISAKYNFVLKNVKGEFGIVIWNILNRKNNINIFYQLNQNDKIEQISQHALGITPNANLRFTF